MKVQIKGKLQKFHFGICVCGKRLNRKNIRYYRDQYGELKPLCKDCFNFFNENIGETK